MILSNDSLNAFQYKLYGGYNKVGSILPIEDFSTINIIEPYLMSHFIGAVPFI